MGEPDAPTMGEPDGAPAQIPLVVLQPDASAMGEADASAWGTSPEIADVLLSVLSHPAAGWRARASAPAVCQTWRRTLAQGDAHKRMLCHRLREECRIYVPGERECPHHDGWAAFFRQLWPLRHTWSPPPETSPATPAEEVRFNISVAVRFRPASRARGTRNAEKVTLPLHQRIQLIRLKHGCSRHDAMQRIAAETRAGGGSGVDPAPGISPRTALAEGSAPLGHLDHEAGQSTHPRYLDNMAPQAANGYAASSKRNPIDADKPFEVLYNRLYAGVQDEAPVPPPGMYEKMEAQRKARVMRKPWLEGRRDTGVCTRDPKVAWQMGVRLIEGDGESEKSDAVVSLPVPDECVKGEGGGSDSAEGGGVSSATGAGGGGAKGKEPLFASESAAAVPPATAAPFLPSSAAPPDLDGKPPLPGNEMRGAASAALSLPAAAALFVSQGQPALPNNARDGAASAAAASSRAAAVSSPRGAVARGGADAMNRQGGVTAAGREGAEAMKRGRMEATGRGGGDGMGSATARIMSLDPECREVVVMAPSVGVRAFNFSSVFAEDATQPEVREGNGSAG
jgi:hypothetical protein